LYNLVVNYLPEKLILLRRHYNYSQDYLAKSLNIDLVDYMGIENGRRLPTYSQMLILAELYDVEVSEIFINSPNVTLHEKASNNNDRNLKFFLKQEKITYKVINYIKTHKYTWVISLLIFLIVLICVGNNIKNSKVNNELVIKCGDNLSVSDDNVSYIDGLNVYSTKQDISLINNEDIVKVVTIDKGVIVLKNDGTIEKSFEDGSFPKLKNIVDIDASNNHVLFLKKNGKVYAYGDNTNGQCDVSAYKKITKIFALNDASILFDKDGNMFYTKEILGLSKIKDIPNIIGIDSSDEITVILKDDGKISCFSKNEDYESSETWDDIKQVVCGDEFVSGLKNDGTVLLLGLSNKDNLIVSKWKNIKAIEANKDFLIAYGDDIKGVGNNSKKLFKEEIIFEKLNQVSNVEFTIDEENVRVSFKPVENANGYQITLIGTDVIQHIYEQDFVDFSVSNFKEKNTYQVEIITLGSESLGYLQSDPLVATFEYEKYNKFANNNKDENIIDGGVVEVPFTLISKIGKTKEELVDYLVESGANVSNISGIVDEVECEGSEELITSIEGYSDGESITKSELSKRIIKYKYCRLKDGD